MIESVYIEEDVRDHPRTLEILRKLPRAEVQTIERYGELFNRKRQNFRLQKQQPALILARKHANHVLSAPADYNIGGQHNFYFSHLLNCVYDCRYCFLQGMFRSANYVLFVNYEDFFEQIAQTQHALPSPGWYFSGYEPAHRCDPFGQPRRFPPARRFHENRHPTLPGGTAVRTADDSARRHGVGRARARATAPWVLP